MLWKHNLYPDFVHILIFNFWTLSLTWIAIISRAIDCVSNVGPSETGEVCDWEQEHSGPRMVW